MKYSTAFVRMLQGHCDTRTWAPDVSTNPGSHWISSLQTHLIKIPTHQCLDSQMYHQRIKLHIQYIISKWNIRNNCASAFVAKEAQLKDTAGYTGYTHQGDLVRFAPCYGLTVGAVGSLEKWLVKPTFKQSRLFQKISCPEFSLSKLAFLQAIISNLDIFWLFCLYLLWNPCTDFSLPC